MDAYLHERRDLARSLLAVQAAITFVTSVEAGLVAIATGNSAGLAPVMGSIGWLILILVTRWRLAGGYGRRMVIGIEISIVVWSAINLALSLLAVRATTGLMALFSGFVLPIVVLILVANKETR